MVLIIMTNKDPVQQIWAKCAPFWHIGVVIVGGIIYLCTFIGLPDRVSALEIKVEKIDTINQRVDDIAEFLQVPKRSQP